MKKKDNSHYKQNISNALFKTLLHRIPPKVFSPYLEEIVDALMDALAKGEVEICLTKDHIQSQSNDPGWPEAYRKALLASGWLQGASSPMVLENNQLSWRRWHEVMNEVTNQLLHRSNLMQVEVNISSNQKGADLKGSLNLEQRNAVEVVSSKNVVLLSGGPGTGKTSTIMQMIERALCINPNLQIGITAPTGKATRRLQESLQKGIRAIKPSYQDTLCKIPCKTIHRWLEASAHGFVKNKRNLLSLGLLVVDEMSMVDVALMKSLLDALPEKTQIILVGDHNQLPPIGSGAIWHHLQKETIKTQFKNGAIHLQKCYRNRGEIALLSEILCKDGIRSFWRELGHRPKTSNVQSHQAKISFIPPLLLQRLSNHSKKLEGLAKTILNKLPKDLQLLSLDEINIGIEGEQLLCCLEELIILSPKRYGNWGVNEIHKAVLGNNFEESLSTWPQGTPVMCSKNQPELQLANGDIGIVIGENINRRLAFQICSEDGNQFMRFIHPARLKAIEPALAMTIHKAQGSEANEVFLLWPEGCTQSHTKDEQAQKNHEERLLYTGITRAREAVTLFIKSDK